MLDRPETCRYKKGVIQPIKREFLRDTAAQQLREAIAAGHWRKHLPSETVLMRCCSEVSCKVADKVKRGPGLATRPCEQTAAMMTASYCAFRRQNSPVPVGVIGHGEAADGTSV